MAPCGRSRGKETDGNSIAPCCDITSGQVPGSDVTALCGTSREILLSTASCSYVTSGYSRGNDVTALCNIFFCHSSFEHKRVPGAGSERLPSGAAWYP